MSYRLRKARLADRPQLEALIARSARQLSLTPEVMITFLPMRKDLPAPLRADGA